MVISKINNLLGIIKIIISILLSIACIYQVGIHSHLIYFIVILFLSFFRKNQSNNYLKGTFSADLVLSILFLSFSWNDYAAFSSFRWRAHILSPILPPISLFISLIYLHELKINAFKLSKFSKFQTSFPLVAILLGIISGITTEINHGVEIFSSFHLLIIILFIFANFMAMKIFFKKEFAVIKFLPISLFLMLILICKSKIYIIFSFIFIFFSFEKIILRKSLNKASLSILNKLLNVLKIMLSLFFLIIILGGINLTYIGKIAKPLDLFLSYRLSINSSLVYAFNNLNEEKVSPVFYPNNEYKLSENLKKIINDEEVKKKRTEILSDFYDVKTINEKIITRNFHNSFLYYYFIHKKIFNYILYFFLIISFGIIIRNQLRDLIQYLIFIGSGLLNYIPFFSFTIILLAILITLELSKALENNYFENSN